MADPDGYKEKVTDEQLVNMIESGIQNSIGDWLNSSDLTRERLRSTYEFAGVPEFHLAPQGSGSSGCIYHRRHLNDRSCGSLYGSFV